MVELQESRRVTQPFKELTLDERVELGYLDRQLFVQQHGGHEFTNLDLVTTMQQELNRE